MSLQRTVKAAVSVQGIGIHSGRAASLRILPAPVHHGVSFVRNDLNASPSVPAHYKNVVNTQMATTLGSGKIWVGTVEHVLAALQGLGVDNAFIEVSGPEVPIMDGSAAPFCEAVTSVGLQAQQAERPYLALRRKVELRVGEKWAVAQPSSRLEIDASIEWDHPAIGYQEYRYVEGKTPFSEIAGARTFGFLREVEALKRMGLAQGGSLENAVVLNDARILNPEGLRFPDEFVRHKVLDALGDFKLAGIPIQAHFRLHRAGHDLHSQLLAAIFRDPDNFEVIDHSEIEERRPSRVRPALAGGLVASF